MFAAIFIPHFQIQSLIRNAPELAGQAIAVLEEGDSALQKVVALNPAASAAGAEPGMTRLRLQQRSGITVRQRCRAQENSAHAALLDCAAAFSPRVEDSAADTVVLDLEGLERLFGSYAEIAAQLDTQTCSTGLQPHIAVAANPDAAIYAARGIAGPRGIPLVIPRGMERAQLAVLPLPLLTADPHFLDTMTRWGLYRFGEFAALPAAQVAARLGQDGVHLHTLARGASARPLAPHREALHFEETMELDYTITLLEPLRFILSRLLEQLCQRLRLRRRATQEVHVRLNAFERVLRLPLPLSEAKTLVELIMLDLEAHPPENAVTTVAVEAIPVRPRAVQHGLFAPLSPEPEKLELTLARIAHIVGENNVGSPELLDTHRPDAFRMNRYGVEPAQERGHHLMLRAAALALRRPRLQGDTPELAFRRFRPALAARVQLRHGVPGWLACPGFFGPVTTASGPWKSSGEWWREERWERDEWDVHVRTQHGILLFRIYCSGGKWFTEGVYD